MTEATSKTDTGWMPQLGYGMIKGRHATSEQYIEYIEAELAALRQERETWRTEAAEQAGPCVGTEDRSHD